MSTLRKAVALHGFKAVLLAALMFATSVFADTLTILSDRSEFHLKPLIQQFEAQTGNTVKAIFVDQGSLPARLQARPGEADLLITTDIVTLAIAKQRGFTVPIVGSKFLPSVPQDFRDPNGYYAATSYRARTMVIPHGEFSKFTDYSDLASGKYRVCVRPLNHAYNINLVSQFIADRGEDFARKWVMGVKNSLSMTPTGSDRSQAGFVAQDKCDVSIMNTYYYGMLQTANSTRKIASQVSLFFPDQAGKGTYILESGVSVTRNSPLAVAFIDYMLSPLGQSATANQTYEYPVIVGDLPDMVKSFAEGQPGVKDGVAKLNFVNPEKTAQCRELAIRIINEAMGS